MFGGARDSVQFSIIETSLEDVMSTRLLPAVLQQFLGPSADLLSGMTAQLRSVHQTEQYAFLFVKTKPF